MKFPTQHVKRKGAKYVVHRDGATTWHTSGANNSVSNTIVHKSVSDAKEYLRQFVGS